MSAFFDVVDLAETVRSRNVVRLRQGGEVENRGLEIFDRATLTHDNLVTGFPQKKTVRARAGVATGRGGAGHGGEGVDGYATPEITVLYQEMVCQIASYFS